MSDVPEAEPSAADDGRPEDVRRPRAAKEAPHLPQRLYYAVKAAEVVAIIVAVVTIGVGWWQYSTNLDNDRTKAASAYFTDYLKLMRELEVEDRAAAERLREWQEKQQEREAELAQHSVARSTSTDAAVGPNDAVKSVEVAIGLVPTQGHRTQFMPTMPSTSDNTASYIVHLAESIFVLQREDEGWRNTVSSMARDHRDAIERVTWHCRAMDRDFRLLVERQAQVPLKCDGN